jgi:hypothetical protein
MTENYKLRKAIFRDVAKPSTLGGGGGGGGGCRHVLTNISYDFGQVVKIFPGGTGGQKNISGLT